MQATVRTGQSGKEFNLEDIVSGTPDLPAMPGAVIRVIELTNSSDTNAAKIGEAISAEQALSARVLRLANSSFFGMARSVTSLREAVVILGLRNVRNLAIVASVTPWLKRPLPGYDLGPDQLILNSSAVASGSQMIAKLAKKNSIAESAYVAGLLCDIGKIALSRFFTEKLALMVSLGLQGGLTFDEVEQKVVGFSHSEVGAYMAESWNLPKEIVSAIEFHHHPSDAPEDHRAVADCLHLATYLTQLCGFGMGGDGLCYELDTNSFERLGLSTEDLDHIINDFVMVYEHHEAMLAEMGAK